MCTDGENWKPLTQQCMNLWPKFSQSKRDLLLKLNRSRRKKDSTKKNRNSSSLYRKFLRGSLLSSNRKWFQSTRKISSKSRDRFKPWKKKSRIINKIWVSWLFNPKGWKNNYRLTKKNSSSRKRRSSRTRNKEKLKRTT